MDITAETIRKFEVIIRRKFDEITARILKNDIYLERGLACVEGSTVYGMDPTDLSRVRIPFRAWMDRAGIARREMDYHYDTDISQRALVGHVCIPDFTMKGRVAVLDVPSDFVVRAVTLGLPDFKGERKKPEGPIVRGARNTTRYEGFAGVGPSEDGRRIVFKFLNGTSFSWSIVDKKFYHGDNGVEFAQSHLGNIVWGGAKPGCPTFFETLYRVADEGWVKNLFAILSNWVKKQVQDYRREGAYKLQEKRLNRLDTMCNPEVIGPIESLAKNNFVDRMNLDRVCQRVFVGDKILAFSEIKEKYALDAWFLKHSGERIHPQYCRDERYVAEGQDLYAEDNREWILGNYMDQYRSWVQAGMSDVFRHVWDTYKFVFPQHDWYFRRLKEVLDELKGYGYDMKRVMDYLLRDLPTQGLVQKVMLGNEIHELTLLRDYAKMMVEMDRRYERYPKSLKMHHDIASKNYTVQQSQVLAKKYETVREGLKRYEWEGKDYVVIVPPTMSSVVLEGSSLNHCVASYVDGMVNGEYAILFLRKKDAPEKSLVTLQMFGDRVGQSRGQSNRGPTDEEQAAIDEFVAGLVKQKELDLVEEAA